MALPPPLGNPNPFGPFLTFGRHHMWLRTVPIFEGGQDKNSLEWCDGYNKSCSVRVGTIVEQCGKTSHKR